MSAPSLWETVGRPALRLAGLAVDAGRLSDADALARYALARGGASRVDLAQEFGPVRLALMRGWTGAADPDEQVSRGRELLAADALRRMGFEDAARAMEAKAVRS